MTQTQSSGASSGRWLPQRLSFVVKAAALIAGLSSLGIGLWSFLAPHSFYDTLAVFPPYNRHFLHDIGAFQIGLGVMVLLSLRWSDALLTTLTGIAAASWIHVLSHVIDHNLGGRPATDIVGLTALALVPTVAAFARAAPKAAAG